VPDARSNAAANLLRSRLVPAAASPASAAARFSRVAISGLRLIAALAEDRTVASRFEGHCGLLAASGTDDCGSLGCTGAIAAATTTAVTTAATTLLLILLCLAAGFAPLWRGIAALAEKCLIVGCKCEFLSAVTAGKLQISSHNGSLSRSFPSGEFLRLFHDLSRYAE
jgi:hypothetical protein